MKPQAGDDQQSPRMDSLKSFTFSFMICQIVKESVTWLENRWVQFPRTSEYFDSGENRKILKLACHVTN